MWSVIRRGTGERDFLVGVISNRREKFKLFCLQDDRPPPQYRPLVEHLDLLIRKTLMRVVGLLTVMIFKRVSESIFFQSEILTACKVKNEKEVGKFTAQKMKFSIRDYFSKCDQIRSKLRIWSLLLTKSLMKNFIFCAAILATSSS